jgi:hypothetical protein
MLEWLIVHVSLLRVVLELAAGTELHTLALQSQAAMMVILTSPSSGTSFLSVIALGRGGACSTPFSAPVSKKCCSVPELCDALCHTILGLVNLPRKSLSLAAMVPFLLRRYMWPCRYT